MREGHQDGYKATGHIPLIMISFRSPKGAVQGAKSPSWHPFKSGDPKFNDYDYEVSHHPHQLWI